MGIGARLLEIMKEKDINTKELADLIGVPPTTLYSLIKRDSTRMDIDLLYKIAHALGMTVDEFLCDDTGEDLDGIPSTLAAHFEGEDFTEEEIAEIESFIKFVKSKRD